MSSLQDLSYCVLPSGARLALYNAHKQLYRRTVRILLHFSHARKAVICVYSYALSASKRRAYLLLIYFASAKTKPRIKICQSDFFKLRKKLLCGNQLCRAFFGGKCLKLFGRYSAVEIKTTLGIPAECAHRRTAAELFTYILAKRPYVRPL